MLMNRVLILNRDSRAKVPIIVAAFGALVVSSTVAGYLLAGPPWVFAPLGVLALVLLGEVHRVRLRLVLAGAPPVESTPLPGPRRRLVTTTDLVVHRYEVPHPKWRGPPLRIVQLTDFHVDPNLPLEYYREAVAAAERTNPDLAVLTGDYVNGAKMLPRLREVLRPIARLETWAVLGNHDYWPGTEDAVRAIIRDCGLHLLTNESQGFSVGENQIAITGCDYPWGTKDPTIESPPDETFHIVLSHTPDNVYRAARAGADLVFSGHYHAGQIRMPVLGPILIPSVYGRRFDRGHFVIDGTHLFVSSGIGPVNLPVRICCRPEILAVDIMEEGRPGGEDQ